MPPKCGSLPRSNEHESSDRQSFWCHATAAGGTKYPTIATSRSARWNEFSPFLAYPKEIRKILYTTNAIESLDAQLRKVIKPKGSFPNDAAVFKILFLAIYRAKRTWKAPIAWNQALAHFSIFFENRFPPDRQLPQYS